jgi:SAM-dependent methyltransferase
MATGYEESGPFLARVALYAWQRDRVDLPSAVVDALADVRGVVLDVGCGPGGYTRRLRERRPDLRVANLDLSAGMRPLVVADAQRLPVADGAADAALAMHMLYHVPDIPAAVAELRRVVRPGGVALVGTNGRDDKPELTALLRDVLREVGVTTRPFASPAETFTAEDGETLGAAFGDVRRTVWDRVVEVPEPGPVVDYVGSLRAWLEPALRTRATWDDVLTAAERLVSAALATAGVFRISTRTALFECR